jgi:electron transport complex protein RnfD
VLFSFILRVADPAHNLPPLFHLLTGGVIIGAFFMATDMVTSPVTKTGMLVFGAGCGVITMLIRKWGGYPEGVSFAILIMNALTPLINRGTRPRVFGQPKTSEARKQT